MYKLAFYLAIVSITSLSLLVGTTVVFFVEFDMKYTENLLGSVYPDWMLHLVLAYYGTGLEPTNK